MGARGGLLGREAASVGTMKLFLVHCGFYDAHVGDGIYESHVNFFVVAGDFLEARLKTKALPEFQSRRMHVDGVQEIEAVDGHRISLHIDATLDGRTILNGQKHRDLAPALATTNP